MCRASILNFKPSRNLPIYRINHRPSIQVNPLLAGGRSVWRISQATRVRILQPTEASFLRLYSFPFSGPRSSALLSGPGFRNGRNFVPGCEMKKAFLLLQCALPILAGCAANSTPAPAPVSVLVTPSSTTVAPGTSAQLTASVTGDSAGKGVNWTVTCPTQLCGSLSPASTPSGVPTTYTAPSPPSTSLTVTITAASVADG